MPRHPPSVGGHSYRFAGRHDSEIPAVRLHVGRLKGRIDFNETNRDVSSAGPSLVALAVWMVAVAIAGRIDDAFVALCTTASFLLTLPVSAIAGLVDGYLAPTLPALLRAPLTAAVGAALASGLFLTLFTMMFSRPVPPEVMNGAFCAGLFLLLPMGVCSLLSNEIDRQRHSIEPACA
ncbi:hypothetical protein [Bradyrhizobium sp. 170]|uniref:hypothetical protein n=1 Tax=Bradyrhizobium sp. 170 TaxID=2782641 RepID=UPI001FFF6BB4|nr:hypothetical protein [Bradyrhizobium sp. 170]UPK03257.1 hypothetical protein IVB05_37950 [Bradyrhizobium sp. 170]